jgi:acyl-CoA thioester hydrolase
MASPFVHELRVRYGECDPQGIVFNANYLLYFDVAFTELWRAAIGPWQEMVERGVDAVVAEARVRFHAPARFDDELRLRARVARLGTTSITTLIDVLRDDDVLVESELRHVCVATWSSDGASNPAKIELPDWVRSGLRRFALPNAEIALADPAAGEQPDEPEA